MTSPTFSKLLVLSLVVSMTAVTGCGQRPAKKTKKVVIKTRSLNAGNKTESAKTESAKTESAKTAVAKTDDKKPSTKRKFTLKPVTPPKTVRLDDITPDELKAFIKKKTGERRAVVVDYWAMWCAPCQKAFPHTVALSTMHAKDGLVVVSVSQDKYEDRDKALSFLKEKKALIYNFFPNDKIDPYELYKAFGTEEPGLPLYRVYGSDGKLAAEVTAEGDSKAKLDAAVRKVLGYE